MAVALLLREDFPTGCPHLCEIFPTFLALQFQVRGLLDKLDVAEGYYASGKMFRSDHAAVGSAEFNARVKCLCMW